MMFYISLLMSPLIILPNLNDTKEDGIEKYMSPIC